MIRLINIPPLKFILSALLIMTGAGPAQAQIWNIRDAGTSGEGLAVPVLPFPRHVEKGERQAGLNLRLNIGSAGLDQGMERRLKDHWENFRGEFNKPSGAAGAAGTSATGAGAAGTSATGAGAAEIKVVLGLLGRDREFDARVAELASEWIGKIGEEGYLFVLDREQSFIAANTETGLFYGLQTLRQLKRAGWNREIFIADWPSFPHRVIYDDISRGPISTVAYIKEQIRRLAELKINYLSFYIEHVVQPLSYPDFAPPDGKLTIAQIKELSAYAEQYHMQLIGSFQSFGHYQQILSLPQYRSMGASPSLISPLDPKARSFLKSVIGELCDAFNAPFFNVNCDETFDLGKGRHKAYVDSVGLARFYADHVKFLYDVVKQKGKRLMMWGDIALQHEEILDLLPRDIIYLTWEYDTPDSYDQWIAPFAERGLEFMVCPGVLNSNRLFPAMKMARSNISGFLKAGREKGASGAFTTIWDDGGIQLFSADWYGAYLAAERSWNAALPDTTSFNERYELNAYGAPRSNYTEALDELMELAGISLTYNLNDQLWHEHLLPGSGKTLLVNNSDVEPALRIIRKADSLVAAGEAERNLSDISTLKYSIDQYRLIMDSRSLLSEVAKWYEKACDPSTPDTASRNILSSSLAAVADLKLRHEQLLNTFRKAWLAENQHYGLDAALQPYYQKISDLKGLEDNLLQAIERLDMGEPLPEKAAMRLDIRESDDQYFKYWLLAGPFPADEWGKLPAFHPPIPGDPIQYGEKTYRWEKHSSENGSIVDLAGYYKDPGNTENEGLENATAYAYCRINADAARTIAAFAAGNKGMEIFCNGQLVSPAAAGGLPVLENEMEISLPLQAGVNHILLIIPVKDPATDWEFTFRLDRRLAVSHHKHKYTLNPKNDQYEAD